MSVGDRCEIGGLRAAIAALIAAALFSALASVPARAQETVTVYPATPDVGNCLPFGYGSTGGMGAWGPYAAFFYKNVPPFELKAGDILAFDLAVMNDANVELDIALARTAVNGGDVEVQPFTTVVTNTQTPANPRGDTTIGNFELQFIAEAPFSFPGGGLVIRFSNPSPAYQLDATCTQVMVHGSSGDASGFFVQRAYLDPDGSAPWTSNDSAKIGAFQVTSFPPPPPDTDPPDTEITKRPKARTKRKVASFEFSSTEPGSTFQCQLDHNLGFSPCASPVTVKVAKGKHNFQVRATDQAGNADPSSASDDWKVKKRKR